LYRRFRNWRGNTSQTLDRYFSFMAGLVPAIHARLSSTYLLKEYWMPGWVYIMTNRPNGTLYTGVTDNLARRAWEHRAGLVEGFTKRYGLTRLVFAEHYDDMRAARQREQNMKHWRRAWKVRLILDQNPEWDDLYDGLS
jgi:putative endonuclease